MSPDGPAYRRIGVFGGTFDPPHLGHLIVARDVAEELELDRVMLVPAARPPHKRTAALTDSRLRLAMVRAAVGGDPALEASDVEVERAGASYTVDTLRQLRESHAGAALFLLLGADQWRDLGSWREPREVGRLATLAVMARSGEAPAAPHPGLGLDCTPVPVTRLDLSSTDIRNRLREGRSIRYLVPPGVEDLIRSNGIYREV